MESEARFNPEPDTQPAEEVLRSFQPPEGRMVEVVKSDAGLELRGHGFGFGLPSERVIAIGRGLMDRNFTDEEIDDELVRGIIFDTVATHLQTAIHRLGMRGIDLEPGMDAEPILDELEAMVHEASAQSDP